MISDDKRGFRLASGEQTELMAGDLIVYSQGQRFLCFRRPGIEPDDVIYVNGFKTTAVLFLIPGLQEFVSLIRLLFVLTGLDGDLDITQSDFLVFKLKNEQKSDHPPDT